MVCYHDKKKLILTRNLDLLQLRLSEEEKTYYTTKYVNYFIKDF